MLKAIATLTRALNASGNGPVDPKAISNFIASVQQFRGKPVPKLEGVPQAPSGPGFFGKAAAFFSRPKNAQARTPSGPGMLNKAAAFFRRNKKVLAGEEGTETQLNTAKKNALGMLERMRRKGGFGGGVAGAVNWAKKPGFFSAAAGRIGSAFGPKNFKNQNYVNTLKRYATSKKLNSPNMTQAALEFKNDPEKNTYIQWGSRARTNGNTNAWATKALSVARRQNRNRVLRGRALALNNANINAGKYNIVFGYNTPNDVNKQLIMAFGNNLNMNKLRLIEANNARLNRLAGMNPNVNNAIKKARMKAATANTNAAQREAALTALWTNFAARKTEYNTIVNGPKDTPFIKAVKLAQAGFSLEAGRPAQNQRQKLTGTKNQNVQSTLTALGLTKPNDRAVLVEFLKLGQLPNVAGGRRTNFRVSVTTAAAAKNVLKSNLFTGIAAPNSKYGMGKVKEALNKANIKRNYYNFTQVPNAAPELNAAQKAAVFILKGGAGPAAAVPARATGAFANLNTQGQRIAADIRTAMAQPPTEAAAKQFQANINSYKTAAQKAKNNYGHFYAPNAPTITTANARLANLNRNLAAYKTRITERSTAINTAKRNIATATKALKSIKNLQQLVGRPAPPLPAGVTRNIVQAEMNAFNKEKAALVEKLALAAIASAKASALKNRPNSVSRRQLLTTRTAQNFGYAAGQTAPQSVQNALANAKKTVVKKAVEDYTKTLIPRLNAPEALAPLTLEEIVGATGPLHGLGLNANANLRQALRNYAVPKGITNLGGKKRAARLAKLMNALPRPEEPAPGV